MSRIKNLRPWQVGLLALPVGAAVLVGGYLLYRMAVISGVRSARLVAFLRDPDSHSDWQIQAGQRCGLAPFQMPTSGMIGYLWDDSFRLGQRHQGIDIFGGEDVNQVAVYAAYAGYLTRSPGWKASLIIRLPQDPLQPGRQIWTYYTHMADSQGNSTIVADFPPGTSEVYVQAGALLGYQGNFSGNPGNPVGVHLHFSIVIDDGGGKWRNELDIRNTLDPSNYFGLPLNATRNKNQIPVCKS